MTRQGRFPRGSARKRRGRARPRLKRRFSDDPPVVLGELPGVVLHSDRNARPSAQVSTAPGGTPMCRSARRPQLGRCRCTPDLSAVTGASICSDAPPTAERPLRALWRPPVRRRSRQRAPGPSVDGAPAYSADGLSDSPDKAAGDIGEEEADAPQRTGTHSAPRFALH